MTDTNRPPIDSIPELSASALVVLEPSVVELRPYEECPADPTVRMLPDFSVVEDAPTIPRAEREQLLKPTELVTLLPPPKTPLPPLPVLPKKARPKKRRSLPPIAPLPAKPRESFRPPALPRDLPRPPATLEWDLREPERAAEDTDERTSVIPVSSAVERAPRRNWRVENALPIAAGAVLGLSVFLGAYFALSPPRPAAKTATNDALLVTVAGSGGGPVEAPQVFVDGVRRCESTPCLVPGLTNGLHFVTVTAPGHVTTSPRVVRVAEREASLMHIELARESEPSPVASAPPTPPAEPPPALLPEPPPPVQPEPPAPAPPRRAPDLGTAFLNLNSVPASGVVLDGQPLGRTPKLNVPVKPGSHVVVFVHPEAGRQARAVVVEPGARQTVAVRF